MDSWKAEVRRVRREKIRRKMQMREKVGKSRFTVFFQWFVAPEGRKVGSLKRRVRSQLARWEMKNCTPLWREAHFQVKMYKTHQCRTTFWSCDVEKVHAVVARSTFPSQNVQNTPMSDHFLKLRCRKSARRCGAKHISKSKCTKHTILGPLFEVAMSKKCTPLWREAHFEVKMYKTHHVRTTFGGSDVDFRKSARRCGAKHISKSNCTKHTMFGPLLAVQMLLRLTRLHYITLHFAALHYITLHYITLHFTTLQVTTTATQLQSTTLHHSPLYTLNYTTLHYTPLHSTTLQLQLQLHNYTPLHYTALHSTTLHYTTLHYTPPHSTTLQLQLHNYSTSLHYTPQHYNYNYTTTLHYTPLHYTSLHYTTLHSTTLQIQLHIYNYTPLH